MGGHGGTASDGKTTVVSPPAPNADKPPRLAAAINEPPNTPDRSLDGSDAWGAAPLSMELIANMLTIYVRLEDDDGFAQVWDTPAGDFPDVGGLVEADERWAKTIEQLFLGSAYGGTDICAQFPSKGSIGNSGYRYIFERFSDEDDPAYSLFVACQHLTTYGVLGRGHSFDVDLKGAGIPANQAAAGLPLYHSGVGKWASPGPVVVDGSDVEVIKITSPQAFDATIASAMVENYGPGTIYTYNPLHFTRFVQKTVHASHLYLDKHGKPKPDSLSGQLKVDPMWAQQQVLKADQIRQAENKLLTDVTQGVNKILKTTLTAPDVGAISSQEGWGDDDGSGELSPVRISLDQQLDGSHACMVLRCYGLQNGKKAVQLLDATAHPDVDTAKMFPLAGGGGRDGGGIYAGEATTQVAGRIGNFVGLGTVPPVSDDEPMLDRMLLARPVGLMRLVLAKRQKGGQFTMTPMTEDDIYYIGPMAPTWSNASPTRNYSISRLLFSLRNTPYYKDVQAFWIVYAPTGALAETMWMKGVRNLPFDWILDGALKLHNDLADQLPPTQDKKPRRAGSGHRESLTTGFDTMPIAVLTHDENGLAQEVWRAHALKAHTGEGSPPKVIRQLFIDTGGPPVDLLTRRRKALDAATLARSKRALDIIKELQTKPDEERKAELNAELAELRDPAPDPEELLEASDPPFSQTSVSQCTVARDGLLATFVNQAIFGMSGAGGTP